MAHASSNKKIVLILLVFSLFLLGCLHTQVPKKTDEGAKATQPPPEQSATPVPTPEEIRVEATPAPTPEETQVVGTATAVPTPPSPPPILEDKEHLIEDAPEYN